MRERIEGKVPCKIDITENPVTDTEHAIEKRGRKAFF